MQADTPRPPFIQSRDDRAWLLTELLAQLPDLRHPSTLRVQALHQQFVEGTLSWGQMRLQLETFG